MIADLHTHSTASDGECTPAQLIAAAHRAGLQLVGLTDHDTVAGVPEATDAGTQLGVTVIAGCEFSVRSPWGEMHLLAYYLPRADTRLGSFLSEQRRNRRSRGEEIVRRLQGIGVPLSFDAVEEEAGGGAIGRPHVARALVKSGAVAHVNAAFDRYLGFRKPAFVPKVLPLVDSVAELVRSIGGVSSAAHLKDRATRGNLRLLKRAGVDGVEVVHPSHDLNLRARVATAARREGLLPTGGSDWHGPDAAFDGGRLGECTVGPDWIQPLEELHGERVGGAAEGAGLPKKDEPSGRSVD